MPHVGNGNTQRRIATIRARARGHRGLDWRRLHPPPFRPLKETQLPAGPAGAGPSGVILAIVDNDPLTRAGIKAIVAARDAEVRVVDERDFDRLLRASTPGARPNVICMEAGLASANEGAAIRAVLRALPGARVIAFGFGPREEELFHIFDAGGAGYLTRGTLESELFTAIRRVGDGGRYVTPEVQRLLGARQRRLPLTPREKNVLQHLAAARSNATIAAVLGISVGTVKLHVKSILSKLGAEDRAEAVLIALDRGFARREIPLPAPTQGAR